MKSGYLLTPHAPGVFEAYENHPQIRYAAELANGEGFAAFDPIEASEISELSQIGAVYLEVDDPADPRWEELIRRPRGPKRRIANGLERFALIKPVGMSALDTYRLASLWGPAAIVSRNFELRVLLETTEEDTFPFECHWNMTTLQHIDRRKLAAV